MLASDLVDVARGIRATDSQRAAVGRHVRECPACAARLERERALSAGLRRLAEDTAAPPIDPDREEALLAAFDAEWAQPPRRVWRYAAVAGVAAAMAAMLVWAVRPAPRAAPPTTAGVVASAAAPSSAPQESLAQSAVASAGPTEPALPPSPRLRRTAVAQSAAAGRQPQGDSPPFVVWPGASELATFESGQLMRIELPASMAVSIGLTPASTAPRVRADVLVDQDGYARAVRLVP